MGAIAIGLQVSVELHRHRIHEGVKMVGRWHDIGRISGTAIAETDDRTLMAKWALEWNDLFEVDVRPVMTDEQASPLMAQIGKQ